MAEAQINTNAQIPLSIKPPQFISPTEYYNIQAQQIQNAQVQQQTQNLAAQQPGIDAQSQLQQIAAQKAQQKMSIVGAHTTTDEDGHTIVDVPGAVSGLMSAGMPDEAIDLANNNNNMISKSAATTADVNNYANAIAKPWMALSNSANNQTPGIGRLLYGQFAKSMQSDPVLGSHPLFATTDDDQTGNTYSVIDPTAYVKSTLQPSDQNSVDNANPWSDVSIANSNRLTKMGITVPPGLSKNEQDTLPGVSPEVSARVVSNDQQAIGAANDATLQKQQELIETGLAAAKTLSNEFTRKLPLGQPLTNIADKYTGNVAYNNLAAVTGQLGIKFDKTTPPDTVIKMLTALKTSNQQKLGNRQVQAGTGQYPTSLPGPGQSSLGGPYVPGVLPDNQPAAPQAQPVPLAPQAQPAPSATNQPAQQSAIMSAQQHADAYSKMTPQDQVEYNKNLGLYNVAVDNIHRRLDLNFAQKTQRIQDLKSRMNAIYPTMSH